jgi:hypothetical protein
MGIRPMFGAKKKKSDADAAGVMQKSSRGNMDEYEALRTIVSENAGLLNRVLEKIKIHRTLSGTYKKSGIESPEQKERVPEKKKKNDK